MWVVNTFGGSSLTSFEISVVREENTQGRKSWGWFGKDKLLISQGDPGQMANPNIWIKLCALAQEIADELNR